MNKYNFLVSFTIMTGVVYGADDSSPPTTRLTALLEHRTLRNGRTAFVTPRILAGEARTMPTSPFAGAGRAETSPVSPTAHPFSPEQAIAISRAMSRATLPVAVAAAADLIENEITDGCQARPGTPVAIVDQLASEIARRFPAEVARQIAIDQESQAAQQRLITLMLASKERSGEAILAAMFQKLNEEAYSLAISQAMDEAFGIKR